MATSLLGSLDDLFCDDGAVRASDLGLFKLTGNALADQVSEAQTYLGDFVGVDGRFDILIAIVGKDWVNEQYGQYPSIDYSSSSRICWNRDGDDAWEDNLRALSSSCSQAWRSVAPEPLSPEPLAPLLWPKKPLSGFQLLGIVDVRRGRLWVREARVRDGGSVVVYQPPCDARSRTSSGAP